MTKVIVSSERFLTFSGIDGDFSEGEIMKGKGTLLVGDPGQTVELTPGVLVAIDPGIIHEIRAQSEVSILLTKFMEK